MRRRYEYEQIQKSKDPLTLSILHFDDNFEDVVSKNKWIKNNISSSYIFKEGKIWQRHNIRITAVPQSIL